MAIPSVMWRRSGVLVLLAGLLLAGWSHGQAKPGPVAPEKLLPEKSLLFIRFDGMKAHSAAMEKTAAYDALYRSDLIPTVVRAVKGLSAQAPPEAQQALADATTALLGAVDDGIDLGVTLDTANGGPPVLWGVVVLRNSGKLEPRVIKALKSALEGEIELQTKTEKGRRITSGRMKQGPFEIGLWAEGEHLVAAFGLNAVQHALAVATGEASNVTANPSFAEFTKSKSFEVCTTAWFDFGALREMFGGMTLPVRGATDPKTVRDVAETLGLGKVGRIVYQGGVKDRSLWTEVFVEAPGPQTGLLSLANPKPITLADLPPLPTDCTAFAAGTNDWTAIYDQFLATLKGVEEIVPEEDRWGTDQVVEVIEDQLGFKVRDDFAAALGDVLCVYHDGQLPLLMDGAVAVAAVQDAAKLEKTMARIVETVRANAGPAVNVRQVKKGADVLTVFEIPQAGVLTPTFCVTDKWFCLAMTPQPVEAFLLRLNGKLPKWVPGEEAKTALAALPKEITSISMRDPRSSIRFVVGLAPTITGLVKTGMAQARRFGANVPELPISVADLPPAEVVSHPLFPNFSVTQSSEKGIRLVNRSSLPGLIEGGPAVAAIGVAILLPAVQQARTAARRTQSANNMKMLGLALHNFHDTFNAFPAGTRPVDDDTLKPDQRSSWLVSILPYVDQAALYNQVTDNKGEWNAEAYRDKVASRVLTFMNPSIAEEPNAEYGPTHYVGVAGLTEKGPTSKVTDNDIAGIFAYDRQTHLRDITDGTSNTMMVVEVSKDLGPWAQGGKATIRPFTKKPYFKGPDGIGGPLPGVTGVLMGDGSVRMVSDKIDAATVEALTTIAGGEVIGEF